MICIWTHPSKKKKKKPHEHTGGLWGDDWITGEWYSPVEEFIAKRHAGRWSLVGGAGGSVGTWAGRALLSPPWTAVSTSCSHARTLSPLPSPCLAASLPWTAASKNFQPKQIFPPYICGDQVLCLSDEKVELRQLSFSIVLSLQLSVTTNLLSGSVNLPMLCISCKWKYMTYYSLCLVPLLFHSYF